MPAAPHHHHSNPIQKNMSILGWPSWLRVLAIAPVVALLWLAVLWANLEQAPW